MAYLVEIAGFTVIEQFSISDKVTSLRVEQQATTSIMTPYGITRSQCVKTMYAPLKLITPIFNLHFKFYYT